MVKDAAGLYELNLENLLQLDKIADKSATNLLRSIEESKNSTLSKFIYALGIRHVGEHIAQLLAKRFQSIEQLQQAHEDELISMNEIGPQIAESVISFFEDDSNKRLIQRLLKAGISLESASVDILSSVSGKSFVISGTLHAINRSEAKDLITRRGGRVASSISRSTDYLVVGESPGSKLQKAKDLGVRILMEDEFFRLFGEDHG